MNINDTGSGDIRYELVAEPTRDTRTEAPWVLLRRVLRGRYRLVITLSLSFAMLGALAGYVIRPPRYESSGLVLLESDPYPLLNYRRESTPPIEFEAFITAQQTRLRSHRVLAAALARPEMADAGWSTDERDVIALQRGLSIARGRRDSTLTVTVTHPDPIKAHAAVNAVLATFENDQFDPVGTAASAKEKLLLQRERAIESEVKQIRAAIITLTDGYGSEAVDRLHAEKVQALIEMEERITGLERVANPALRTGEQARSDTPLFARNVAKYVADLEQKELALLAELQSRGKRYGPNHRVIQDLRFRLESVSLQIDLCERALMDGNTDALVDPPLTERELAAAGARRLRLRQGFEAQRDAIRAEVEALAPTRTKIAELDDQVREMTDRLWETRRRLDEIQVESERDDVQQTSIAAWGDLPVTPASDRRAALTAIGALFGAGGGLVLVVLIGLVDPRVRYVEELERLEVGPVLALLPEITDGDQAGAERATRVVDRLCGQLELRGRDPRRNVHCVTSAERGAGRTSIALALARSFAAAGRRTLLIDADAERADLSRALDLASPALVGDDGPNVSLRNVLHDTGCDGLWAIPFGGPNGLVPADLSKRRLAERLESLRGKFDAIVIDSGPLLACPEACVVAAVSDNVVMVAARFGRQQGIRASLVRLAQADVTCAGFVFNRAGADDPGGQDALETKSPARLAPFASDDLIPPRHAAPPPAALSIDEYRTDSQEETGEGDSWKRAA